MLLVGVVIEIRSVVYVMCRMLLVKGKCQWLLVGLWMQFFLIYIVCLVVFVLIDIVVENQYVDQITIVYIEVILVVQFCIDDNYRMIVCFISVIGKFMGDVNNLVVRNVGNLFGLGWGISFYIVIVGCIVNVVQVMFQIVVCQCQIINGGYQGGVVISQLQVFYRQFVQQYVFQFYFVEVFCVVVIKVWEVYFSDFILVIQQVQLQFGFFVSFVVVLFKILFVFFVLVEVNRIVRCNYFVIGIKGDSFLFWIVFLVQCINQISSV